MSTDLNVPIMRPTYRWNTAAWYGTHDGATSAARTMNASPAAISRSVCVSSIARSYAAARHIAGLEGSSRFRSFDPAAALDKDEQK
eukprot:29060-Pelagococcus_subviridis.AAC.2